MNYNLIKFSDNYIIVSDEEAKTGQLSHCKYADEEGIEHDGITICVDPILEKHGDRIIASNNPSHNLPSINLSLIKKVLEMKGYSLEDMKALFDYTTRMTIDKPFDEVIQSLQKKEWEVELEMETRKNYGGVDCGDSDTWTPTSYQIPKITNNQVKILKIL